VAPTLDSLGWSPFFAGQLEPGEPGVLPARVVAEHRGAYRIVGAGAADEGWAVAPPRLRRSADGPLGLPAVGDWLAVRTAPGDERASIERVLRRRSAFLRRAAGSRGAQVVAANVDVVFVVSSLNRELNPRRLERYLTLAWNSGAPPVVVLSKADLCADVAAQRDAVARIALGAPVHVVSAHAGSGLDGLRGHLGPGRTAVLLGSSGVGKSTLVNVLGGSAVQEVRATLADDRGVHTTTARQLLFLPGGGMLIDTPGMREVGLVGGEDGLARAFADVAELAAACRFGDCRHESDPGCAVRDALADGALPSERWDSYRKLQREIGLQPTRPEAARGPRPAPSGGDRSRRR
jgi:ribosome biogenesis GTPase